MSMNINDKIVAEIMNDSDFENELKDYLNEIIDGEINKGDDMDDELVHDCIEALVALESSSVEEAVEKLRSSKNIVKFVHRKSFVAQARRKRIAAAIAVILIAHTASYMTIPAYASSVDAFFESIADMFRDIDEQDENDPNMTFEYDSMWYEPPEEEDSKPLKSEADLDLSGYKFYVSKYDGSEMEVPYSECKTITKTEKINGKRVLNVIVKYENVECAIQFILEDK